MSDTPAAEKIVSESALPETSPAQPAASTEVPAAEAPAPIEGGAPAPVEVKTAEPTAEPTKVEDKLEASKKDTDVAGRKEKGVLSGGILKKLIFWKKGKKGEAA